MDKVKKMPAGHGMPAGQVVLMSICVLYTFTLAQNNCNIGRKTKISQTLSTYGFWDILFCKKPQYPSKLMINIFNLT